MRVIEVKKQELKDRVSKLDIGFALLEAEIMQDTDYDLQAESLKNELPESKSAIDLIKEVDPHTINTIIWDETQFDKFINRSPLLCTFHNKEKLIEKYLSLWGGWNAGIFIDALSETGLIKHLRSLLLVQMPKDGEVHYRFQESRKLSGILNALDSDERLSDLLGPIRTVFWQENCGTDKTYCYVENPKPQSSSKEIGWFHFTPSEKQKMNDAESAWHKRSIISTIQSDIKNNEYHTQHLKKYVSAEIDTILDKGYQVAQNKNIKNEENLRYFLINNLFYPKFMNGKEATRIINQGSWLEPKKINTLKEMLEKYKEEQKEKTNV